MAKGFDLHMAVMADAIERTQEEYDALFEQNGYQRVATHYLAGYPLYVQELKLKTGGTEEEL
jgi:hypothetical protein